MLILVGILFLGSTEAEIQSSRLKADSRPLCPCEDSPLHTRVVGGHQAGLGVFPYAVGLQYSPYNGSADRSPYCGGTLITDSHVVTAAHCAKGSPKDILIDVGIYAAQQRSETPPTRVRAIKQFPKYVPNVFHYDIALLELESPVSWRNGLHPAVLPPSHLELKEGVTVTVYGWGRLSYVYFLGFLGGGLGCILLFYMILCCLWCTCRGIGSTSTCCQSKTGEVEAADGNCCQRAGASDTGEKPRTLQSVSLPVVDNASCQQSYITTIMDNMLCAGGQEGKDACVGDSGSGLVVRLENTNVLCGLVSFGRKCALPHIPGAYTRVSSYTDWIMAETLSATCAPCVYGGYPAQNVTSDEFQ